MSANWLPPKPPTFDEDRSSGLMQLADFDKWMDEFLMMLRVNCDPQSPFFGMIDMESEGALLTLPT